MHNVTEEVVRRAYAELAPAMKEAHAGCEVCREDVMVYALNRLAPHYVATLKGEVLSKIEMDAGQGPADVTVAIMEALRFVAAAPRCGRSAILP